MIRKKGLIFLLQDSEKMTEHKENDKATYAYGAITEATRKLSSAGVVVRKKFVFSLILT